MVFFFFYEKEITIEQIKKIDDKCEIYNGYILVYQIDPLLIKETIENNKICHGKIVKFSLNKDEVILKLKKIFGFEKIENVLCVWSNKMSGGIQKTYIISNHI